MASTAYHRILHYCRENADASNSEADEVMVLDAWAFIDVVKRLRSVLEHTPGLKASLLLRLFLKSTEEIPSFRHHVQHIEERMAETAKTGGPIWGSFSWACLDPDGKRFKICAYVPGRLATAKGIPVVNPAGREFHDEIDHFEMTVGIITLNLSDIFRNVETLKSCYESSLALGTTKTLESGETIKLIDLDDSQPADQ